MVIWWLKQFVRVRGDGLWGGVLSCMVRIDQVIRCGKLTIEGSYKMAIWIYDANWEGCEECTVGVDLCLEGRMVKRPCHKLVVQSAKMCNRGNLRMLYKWIDPRVRKDEECRRKKSIPTKLTNQIKVQHQYPLINIYQRWGFGFLHQSEVIHATMKQGED